MAKHFFWPISVATFLIANVCGQESNGTEIIDNSIYIGPCVWVIDRKCPDDDVKIFLFTPSNSDDRQPIHVDDTWDKSNISSSHYDPKFPVKVIIHGYNSDMQLTPLIDMRQEYLLRGQYNLFFVDWSVLGPAPCKGFLLFHTHFSWQSFRLPSSCSQYSSRWKLRCTSSCKN